MSKPKALFRRYSTNQPMPIPERGATIDLLRSFLRVANEEKWILLLTWLIAAFLPDIPHPILCIYGEQGSAKSSQARLLTRLIDPSNPLAKGIPKDLMAWVQTADHNWATLLDNLSEIKQWLSDALCRVVTSEGFSKRKLYSDSEDIILSFRRVVITTSIEVPATRSDLLDRVILLEMPPIPRHERISESEYEARFIAAWPLLLGVLLDLVAGVLRELPNVHADNLPRMADFAHVGLALEKVQGWPEGSFMAAYNSNMEGQHQEALEASPVAGPLRKLMDKPENKPEWRGTALKLLGEINTHSQMHDTFSEGWPKHPNKLSNLLRRIAPNLRAYGLDVEFPRSNGERLIVVRHLQTQEMEEGGQAEPAAA